MIIVIDTFAVLRTAIRSNYTSRYFCNTCIIGIYFNFDFEFVALASFKNSTFMNVLLSKKRIK